MEGDTLVTFKKIILKSVTTKSWQTTNLYVEQLKVLGPVHRDGPLRLFAEAGDDKELSIVGPHDPCALLRHNRPSLDQRVRRATWRVDADLSSRQV